MSFNNNYRGFDTINFVDHSATDTAVVECFEQSSKCIETTNILIMKRGYTYILKCSDNSYYTGSTINLEKRLLEHQAGRGANYTKMRLPVELVYFEEYPRIDEAFYREKQIQGWSRKKKEALIKNTIPELSDLSRKIFNKET